MVRKFFALDKNYLLEEAQLSLQHPLLCSLIEAAKDQYEIRHNPLMLQDSFHRKIQSYQPGNLKPLDPFYQSLAGIYRYKFGDNQLEFLWDGESHQEKYRRAWREAFEQWSTQLLEQEQFIQAVFDLTVFLPENRHAQLAENRMNHMMLHFFSRLEGFQGLRLHRKKGIIEMAAPGLRCA